MSESEKRLISFTVSGEDFMVMDPSLSEPCSLGHFDYPPRDECGITIATGEKDMSRRVIRGKVSGRQIAGEWSKARRMAFAWKRLSKLYRGLILKQNRALGQLKNAIKTVHDSMRCCGNCNEFYKDKNQRLRCGGEKSENAEKLVLPWAPPCPVWKLSERMVPKKTEVEVKK